MALTSALTCFWSNFSDIHAGRGVVRWTLDGIAAAPCLAGFAGQHRVGPLIGRLLAILPLHGLSSSPILFTSSAHVVSDAHPPTASLSHGRNATGARLTASCGTDMLRNGAHIRDVQHALGHAHLATTEIYLPLIVNDLREAMGGRSYR